jgi:hypothetical protein
MESPISVYLDGVRYTRNPKGRQRANRVYYSPPRGSGLEQYHREIYKRHHGPIPDGYHVHHKDDDPFNNDPSNLVALSPPEHFAEHADEVLERNRGPRQQAHLADVRHLASEWHRSDEGRAWHREHGARTWEDREHVEYTCVTCGTKFLSRNPRGAKHCSKQCIEKDHRDANTYKVRVPCPLCGTEFWQNKYRVKPETCGRTCGAALRRARAAGRV